MRLVFYMIGCFLTTLCLHARDVNTFSANDVLGFPMNTVFEILEGDNDVVWFGTNEGLVSYDGVTFQTFINPDYDIAYTRLIKDPEGRIWCVNFSGQLFYLENDTLHLAMELENKSEFISDFSLIDFPTVYVFRSSHGEVLSYDFISKSTTSLREFENMSIFSLQIDEALIVYAFSKITENKESCLVQTYGLSKNKLVEKAVLDYTDFPCIIGKFFLIGTNNAGHAISIMDNALVYDLDGLDTIWIDESINHYAFNHAEIIDNELWLLTKTGGFIWNLEQGKPSGSVLSDVSVSSVMKDKNGNFWIGSLTRGLFVVSNRNFTHIRLPKLHVSQAVSDFEEGIYIQDDGGMIYFTKPPYENVVTISKEPLERAPLFYDTASSRLYIGHDRCFYDVRSQSFYDKSRQDSYSFIFKKAVSIGGGAFIGTSYGTSFISRSNSKTLVDFPFYQFSEDVVRPWRSNHIALTDSNLYVDYLDGLHVFTRDKNIEKILHNGRDIQVQQMITDDFEKNTIWLSTKNHLLLRITEKEVVETLFFTNIITQLLRTEKYLFAAHRKGIYRINIENGSIDHIDQANGWTPSNVKALFEWDGQLLIVGGNSIQFLPLDDTYAPIPIPQIYITDVRVKNQSYPKDVVVKLPARRNEIFVKVRAMSVRSQNMMSFEYQLSGQSDEWYSTPSNAQEIRLYNLNAGNYTLKVRACTPSGNCSFPESVNFYVMMPLYGRWWFLLLLLLLIIGSVVGLVQRKNKIRSERSRVEAERQLFLKEVYKSRISALRAQMNPHFMFNALNAIQEFILSNQQYIASEYLADFADLMRMYLSHSTKDAITLAEEEQLLRLYLRLENMRFDNTIEVTFRIDQNLDKESVYIPLMLVQPHVENSIKHGLMHANGQSKTLLIEFELKDSDTLLCVIEDNGIGRSASGKINANKTHKSFSSDANQDRIKLMNQVREQKVTLRIFDLEEEGRQGTRVEIELPIERQ